MLNNRSKASIIEEKLNTIKIHPQIGLGELVGVFLHLHFRDSMSNAHKLFWSLKQLFIHVNQSISIVDMLDSYIRGQNYKKSILISVVKFSNRYMEFFTAMIKENEKVKFLWHGQDTETLTSSYNEHKSRIKKSYWNLNITKNILQLTGLSWSDKILVVAIGHIQWRIWRSWCKLLEEKKFDLVLTDFDRHPSNVVMVLAARACKVTSVSLVHGATNPYFHYVPVIADQLWVWGNYHLNLFQRISGNTSLSIRIVGNPKAKNFHPKLSRKWDSIGFGMTLLEEHHRNALINLFINGSYLFKKRIIKIHPQESVASYEKYSMSDVEIRSGESSAGEFLANLDVLCVRRSQIGSDALPYDIPIIVCDNILNSDLQNGEILNIEAAIPIVNNAEELSEELKLLMFNTDYLNERLNKQRQFCEKLYSYCNETSVREMSFALNTLISS